MAPKDQKQQFDRAFDRIEETILPCIGMLLDTLLEASELRRTSVSPQNYAVALRMLGMQVEALTREIEALSPARSDTGSYRCASSRA